MSWFGVAPFDWASHDPLQELPSMHSLRRALHFVWSAGLLVVWAATASVAQDDAAEDEDWFSESSNDAMVIDPLSRFNVPLPTLGGKQLWTDHRWWYGYKVQSHSLTGHWRLLDPAAIRRAWGTKEHVLAELERVQATEQASPVPIERAVLLLHGLMRTSSSMQPLAREIETVASAADKTVMTVPFAYASTRNSIASHADAFRELVENLPGEPRMQWVGHSLGNIVMRQAIAQWQAAGDPANVLARLDRVVMLGPPNQGSSFAKKLSQLGLFQTITGRSGLQLGPDWQEFQEGLGTPPCPFAIVAGDLSQSRIQNPWLAGPSDGIVTVEEAKLEGMQEFVTVPVVHSFLMRDPRTVQAVVGYLSGESMRESLEENEPR
jgi:hypothetical protein